MISIVIPCKSRLEHLKKCLPTVLNQTYKDLQIIIVDFNCPENTAEEIRKSFIDERIMVIEALVDKDHWNLSESRNTGFRYVTGENVLFLDADTILQPTFIEESIKLVDKGSFASGLTSPPWNGCGCMMVNSRDFALCRGYNEAMKGWGMEDMNMYHRLELSGLKHNLFNPELIINLEHSDEERNTFHGKEDKYKTLEENNQIHLRGVFKSSI